MFYSRTSMNKLSNIHEKCLRFIVNNYDSNFNELLESSHELAVHKTCINYLMIEVHKYLHLLSLELMTEIFTLRKNPYKIRSVRFLALKIHGKTVKNYQQNIWFCRLMF